MYGPARHLCPVGRGHPAAPASEHQCGPALLLERGVFRSARRGAGLHRLGLLHRGVCGDAPRGGHTRRGPAKTGDQRDRVGKDRCIYPAAGLCGGTEHERGGRVSRPQACDPLAGQIGPPGHQKKAPPQGGQAAQGHQRPDPRRPCGSHRTRDRGV